MKINVTQKHIDEGVRLKDSWIKEVDRQAHSDIIVGA